MVLDGEVIDDLLCDNNHVVSTVIAGTNTGLDINYLMVRTFGANHTASKHLPIRGKNLYSVLSFLVTWER